MNSLCGIAMGGYPRPPSLRAVAIAAFATSAVCARMVEPPKKNVICATPYVFELSVHKINRSPRRQR